MLRMSVKYKKDFLECIIQTKDGKRFFSIKNSNIDHMIFSTNRFILTTLDGASENMSSEQISNFLKNVLAFIKNQGYNIFHNKTINSNDKDISDYYDLQRGKE